ncbi:hypothetical protein BH11ARM1_BH11ARM1_15830 [soil metagenome]
MTTQDFVEYPRPKPCRGHIFKASPWGIAFYVALCEGVLIGLLTRKVSDDWLLAALPGMIIGATMMFIMTSVFAIQIGEGGVHCFDAFGRYLDVPWEEMISAFPLLGFLMVKNTRFGRALCFPLFLKRRREFIALLREYAPPENPMRLYMEKRFPKEVARS